MVAVGLGGRGTGRLGVWSVCKFLFALSRSASHASRASLPYSQSNKFLLRKLRSSVASSMIIILIVYATTQCDQQSETATSRCNSKDETEPTLLRRSACALNRLDASTNEIYAI